VSGPPATPLTGGLTKVFQRIDLRPALQQFDRRLELRALLGV
jgi:hypothetical protein